MVSRRSAFATIVVAIVATAGGLGGTWPIGSRAAVAQNDWQFPDPYFGVPQPANPAAPSIQRRYRTEIGPPAVRRQQEPVRPPQRVRRPRLHRVH